MTREEFTALVNSAFMEGADAAEIAGHIFEEYDRLTENAERLNATNLKLLEQIRQGTPADPDPEPEEDDVKVYTFEELLSRED